MYETKRIWLTGQGHINNGKESLYNITLHNISFSVSFMPDRMQTHMNMTREELILLRDAIDEELND
jgi:hypothetical protein